MAAMTIWRRVDELIDRAPSLSDLRAHRIQLLAARRWRSLGSPVPVDLVREERLSSLQALSAQTVLTRARAAYDDTMIVIKGPEVAALYPEPTLRSFTDVDLLVPDVERAEAALLAAGFAVMDLPPWAFRLTDRGAVDLFADKHHSRPLVWPGFPLGVELHRWPSWPWWATPPRAEELFEAAVPASVGVAGVLTLRPAAHALALAAHAWTHQPLGRIRDLLDIRAVSDGADREELARLARAWGIGRLWATTIGAADELLDGDGRRGPHGRTWGRNLYLVRERTVLDSHLETWFSPFAAMPVTRAVRVAGVNFASDLRPSAGESWRSKLRRIGKAVLSAFARKSAHDARLGNEGRQLPRHMHK